MDKPKLSYLIYSRFEPIKLDILSILASYKSKRISYDEAMNLLRQAEKDLITIYYHLQMYLNDLQHQVCITEKLKLMN